MYIILYINNLYSNNLLKKLAGIWLSGKILGVTSAAFICGAALAQAIFVSSAAYAGGSMCSATVGAMSFPVLAGTGAAGTSTVGDIGVSCRNIPDYITNSNGIPFCLMLVPSAADASYTAAGTRVMYLNGQPGAKQIIDFQFFSNYRGCNGTDHGKNPPLTCQWGGGGANYGDGYNDYAYRSKANGTWQGQAVITSRQALWAGNYSNNFTLRLAWNDIKYPSGTPGTTPGGMYQGALLCQPDTPVSGSAEYPLKVSAQVRNNCSIVTGSQMNFGRHISLAEIQRGTPPSAAITAQCSSGGTYQIGISQGDSPSGIPWSGGWRGMQCAGSGCGSSVIYYNLYKDAQLTDVWGDIGSANTMSNLMGNGLPQTYTVYGGIGGDKVEAANGQPVPPIPGNYKDRVIITLQGAVIVK